MFENQVKEFAELMGADVQQVYNEMRRTAIMETDLSGFGRILKDLKEIEDISRFDAVLLRDNLIDPYVTYEELGNARGVSRQVIHWRMKQLAESYKWVKALMYRKAVSYHQTKKYRNDHFTEKA